MSTRVAEAAERALELLPDDIEPRNVIGKIAVLRQLGDFVAAESLASHPPPRPTGDWELERQQPYLPKVREITRHQPPGLPR